MEETDKKKDTHSDDRYKYTFVVVRENAAMLFIRVLFSQKS